MDVNAKDASENTALMVAAGLGHLSVLKVMLAHPLLNIQAGVREYAHMYLTIYTLEYSTLHGSAILHTYMDVC